MYFPCTWRNLFFFLKISFVILLIDSFPYANLSSLRLLKGIPRRQKRACAMTPTRKQSMATGWPLSAQNAVKLAICPAFKSVWMYLPWHQLSQNSQEYTYLILLSNLFEFSQQVSKDMEMWTGSITTQQWTKLELPKRFTSRHLESASCFVIYNVRIIHLNL